MGDSLNTKLGNKGILNVLTLRERGLITNLSYKQDVMSIKMHNHPNLSQPTYSKNDGCSQFFRISADGCVVGVKQTCNSPIHEMLHRQQRNRNYNILLGFKFIYNKSCKTTKSQPLPYISRLQVQYKIFESLRIADSADMIFNNDRPLLYVGNHHINHGAAILSFINCVHPNRICEWKIESYINCCASNIYSNQFVVGCENGVYFCKNLKLSSKSTITSNVASVEFNKDGNSLFASSKDQGVKLFDIRENVEKNIFNMINLDCSNDKILTNSITYATRMKLLSDQVSLVVSDSNQHMSKIDLRMLRCVFHYPDHVGFEDHKPLCFDEDLDLISAVGNDNYARLWSMHSGNNNQDCKCGHVISKTNNLKVIFDREYLALV
ncbi:hypothetical protein CDAR_232571 [Caerostris darwini]|uniref:Uncharacterized protein n=1 Tax=Caerostris darwini TaxID=1538125 RepID=A0AAV4W6N5_9ARAC|nr:hypothetical protein CDAR_232571 [Caerostris darwini]